MLDSRGFYLFYFILKREVNRRLHLMLLAFTFIALQRVAPVLHENDILSGNLEIRASC